MDIERRGGRGDRLGRYGKPHNNHNYQDKDYRDYGEEDEESGYDATVSGNRPFGFNNQTPDLCDFSQGCFQEPPGFHEREVEHQGAAWPPCPHPELTPTTHRERDVSKRAFVQTWTGLYERSQGKGGTEYQENNNWGHGDEQLEYSTARQQEGNRFSHRPGKRKVVPGGKDEHGTEANVSLEELDQRDQDYRADLDHNQRPSHIVMLRMLPPNVTTNEIRAQLQGQGIHPKEVRLMRNKSSGQSRGFAFVEFNLIQEATCWMETNQGVLLILGQRVSMHYSDPKPRANEDWLCNKCGVQNFKRREKCFKCSVPKSEAELKLPQLQRDLLVGLQNDGPQGLLPLPVHYQPSSLSVAQGQGNAPQQQGDVANDTLILRNLGPHTSVDAILSALAPFATLSPSNIRLIKDKHTHLNRGFAFLQLSTIVEASQLLQILQALQPALSIDGKAIVVEFAKGSKRDVFVTDGSRVSAATVASTAIAAAQWAVTQSAQNASGESMNGAAFQQGAAVTYNQDGNTYSGPDSTTFKAQAHAGVTVLPSATASVTGAYTAAGPDTVTSEEAVQQPLNAALVTTSATQVEIVGNPQPAISSQPAIPGTEHELKQYPVPDMSTYQYDESSGYYYDLLTGLYYDPNSQYYYNAHTQQYMYWDGEKQTYIPAAAGQSNTDSGNCNVAPSDSPFPSPNNKDKKEKTKSKTAQQIAKDMERWAKSLNRHKENMRTATAAVPPTLPPGQMRVRGHGRLDDNKESASADAGYAVLEKKGALSERPQIFLDQMRQMTENSPVRQQGLVPDYNGEVDSDDEGGQKDEREGRMTDWVKLACLLCRRQFPSKEALIRHQQLSELHKQNLEQRKSLHEHIGKEKLSDGIQPPNTKRIKIIDGILGTSPGARMLQ